MIRTLKRDVRKQPWVSLKTFTVDVVYSAIIKETFTKSKIAHDHNSLENVNVPL